MPATVLLSTAADSSAQPIREILTNAGLTVREHLLGAAPGVDFAGITVAIIEVGGHLETATAQTRRWRAEIGDQCLPIIWVLPRTDATIAARGLDSGADTVLAHPLDAILVAAQVRAATRTATVAERVAKRAAEARILGDQLNRAFVQIDREHEATRSIRLAMLRRLAGPSAGCRFAVCHRPRGRKGSDFYSVWPITPNRWGFLVGDVIDAQTARGLLGLFVADTVVFASRETSNSTPGILLEAANRELLRLNHENSPLVGLIVGYCDCESGFLEIARAGLPSPVIAPREGEARLWALPGPFLGLAETTFPTQSAELRPGDKVLLGTDGTRPDGVPGPADDTRLRDAATRHHELTGQAFVDAVAGELLTHVNHDEDITLLCLERGI